MSDDGADDDNIVDFPGISKLDLDPARVLQKALDAGMTEVVIIGYDRDGGEYFASSKADGAQVVWHIERAKHRLMTIVDAADD